MRSFSALFGLLACSLATPLASQDGLMAGTKCVWPGWKGIKHMVTFGDSYSQTGFQTSGTQPGPGNPFGNPPYPFALNKSHRMPISAKRQSGWPATNGPNWIDFLVTQYNTTFIEVINLAYGGAVVDESLVQQYATDVQSLKDQVQNEFLPNYATGSKSFPWKASDTLFGIWIGINDVGNTYYLSDSTMNSKIFAVYTSMVDKLYKAGARNFVFLNVPPTNRSPSIASQGTWAVDTLKTDIADFNSRISALASNLTKTYSDAKTMLFDTYSLFDNALSEPCEYVETCPIKNTTQFCASYASAGEFTFDSSCGVPVDEYFWLNDLHPTWRPHELVAAHVAAQLESEAAC